MLKLVEMGLSEQKVMKQLGKARGWVQLRFMLLKLPKVVQDEVEAGNVTQPAIRDIYTIHQNGELSDVIEAVKECKDAKLKGQSVKLTIKRRNKKGEVVLLNTKKSRKRPEMLQLLDSITETLPCGLYTRILAWCAGEIDDEEMYGSIKTFADKNELLFIMPKFED